MKMNEFANKVVVISGVSHGIGLALLQQFMKLDCYIVCIDKNPLPITINDKVCFIEQDLKYKESIDILCNCVKQLHKEVHIMVNNACVNHKGLLSKCSYNDFNEVLQVGVSAPYEIVNQLHPLLHDASIINMTSTRAFMSQADSESYTAAKGAIYAMSHAMSISLRGIARVNSIAPGWIETHEETHSLLDNIQHPVGRVGEVSDIVNMVLYLCSEKAGFITGQNFIVDGGMSTQMIYHDDHGWTYKK